MLPALNDLKGYYVEVANPLLSRAVVEASHSLPESLRRARRAAKAVHKGSEFDMPFTDRSAPASRATYFAQPGFRDEIRRGLSLPAATRLFSDEAIAAIETTLSTDVRAPVAAWARVRPRMKEIVPSRLGERLKPRPRLTASEGRLAFRAYIAVRIVEMLGEDSALLRRPDDRS
jgi:hypothetical protein